MSQRALTIILAGGKGTRLEPLTTDRAKPAVPFAGEYRIIDFPLSNCVNSGLFQVLVLTQYKSLSLDRHLDRAWKPLFQRELGTYLDIVPPQQRVADEWYRGTADAVYQNIYSIKQARPDNVLILAGDHIYTMDYRAMLRFHEENHADVTVGAYRVPVAEAARQFGVIQVDGRQRVTGFQEKPEHPTPIPGAPQHTLASMGIYVFSTKFLLETLEENADKPGARHDFGHHILPEVYRDSRVFAFPFRSPNGTRPYWKDVGTLDAYFRATQDLLRSDAPLKLHDTRWPIRTFKPNLSPPLMLSNDDGFDEGVRNSIVCAGSVVDGASVCRSVLGSESRVSPGAMLEETLLLGEVTVGRNARLHRVIVDKQSVIPDGMRIGFDPDEDAERGFTISPEGITVVPRGYRPTQPPFVRRPQRLHRENWTMLETVH